CDAATADAVPEGRVGAGTGALVGKIGGLADAMPGGVGTAAARVDHWTVAALAVVNALGDVRRDDATIIAGARDSAGRFIDATRRLADIGHAGSFAELARRAPPPATSTTLVVIATDAALNQTSLQMIARAGSTAMARCITPVHTPFDGDVVFAVSTAEEQQPWESGALLALGEVATQCVVRAIQRAVSDSP
ncbi:MAG: P1 family peptidase, partial [Longimicrobiales bacterium]